jgi:frataxin-like iron-binding protein CyaY
MPRTRFGGVFLASAQTALQFAVSRHAWVASGTAQSLWMSITGSSSGEARKIARSKVDLHELSPVGRRTSRR